MLEDTEVVEKLRAELERQERQQQQKIDKFQSAHDKQVYVNTVLDICSNNIDDLAAYATLLEAPEDIYKFQNLLSEILKDDSYVEQVMKSARNLFSLKKRGLEKRAQRQCQRAREPLVNFRRSLERFNQDRGSLYNSLTPIQNSLKQLELVREYNRYFSDIHNVHEIEDVESFFEFLNGSLLTDAEKTKALFMIFEGNVKFYEDTLLDSGSQKKIYSQERFIIEGQDEIRPSYQSATSTKSYKFQDGNNIDDYEYTSSISNGSSVNDYNDVSFNSDIDINNSLVNNTNLFKSDDSLDEGRANNNISLPDELENDDFIEPLEGSNPFVNKNKGIEQSNINTRTWDNKVDEIMNIITYDEER